MRSPQLNNVSKYIAMNVNKSVIDIFNLSEIDVLNVSYSYGASPEPEHSPPSKDSVEYILRKYAYPIICVLGVLGNTMSAFVFFSPGLRKYSCSIFLAMRSISDNGVLFSLIVAWLDFLDVRIFHIHVVCQITVFLSYFCSFLSVWCVVCVTLDNYIRMCHPSFVNVYCKSKYAIVIMSLLIFVSLCIYHIPLWTTYVGVFAGKYYCMTQQRFFDIQYILTYIDTALTFIVPLATILICMSLLIFKAVQSHQRTTTIRNRLSNRRWPSSTCHYLKVTKLLFAVSAIFLVLHTPTHVIKLKTVIEAFSGNLQQPSKVLKTLDYVFQVMYCLNFAVNFLVYYSFGNNFRKVYACYICDVSKFHDGLCERKTHIFVHASETLSTNMEAESNV